MTVTLVVVVLLGGVATVLVLALVTVRATDRLRVLADRLLQLRDEVVPAAERLRDDATRARAHAERIRTTGLRPGDGTPQER